MQTNPIEALRWRCAVQYFDSRHLISQEDLRLILEAGRLTPSSFGFEPWKFLVVENPALRQKVRAAAYDQPRVTEASHLVVLARRTDMREHGADDRTARTAALQGKDIASLAGFQKMLNGVVAQRDDAGLDTWNAKQVYIALGMMMETASMLGIDNAAMEGFDEVAVNAVLDLPSRHLSATVLLSLGYRADTDPAAVATKVRRTFDDTVEFMR